MSLAGVKLRVRDLGTDSEGAVSLGGVRTTDGGLPCVRKLDLRCKGGIWAADLTLEVECDVEVSAIAESGERVVVVVKADHIVARRGEKATVDGEPVPLDSDLCLQIRPGGQAYVRHGELVQPTKEFA